MKIEENVRNMGNKEKLLDRWKVNKKSGVTLLALVITIVVLLIITTIVLSLTIGDNGILNKAKEARNKTTEDNYNTQASMNTMYEEMVNAEASTGGTSIRNY